MTIVLSALLFLFCNFSTIFAKPVKWKELRALPFPENYPTKQTADRLYDEMLFHRATQVVLWSLPAMTLWAMMKGSEAQFGASSNVFPIWKDRFSAETLVSTPNSDVIYGMDYLDLKKDGPTVIEVPPKLQGILDDFWHRPLTEVGFVGPDKGKGGNYLILPPYYKGEKPEGYGSFIHSSLPVFPAHPHYLVSTFFEPESSIASLNSVE